MTDFQFQMQQDYERRKRAEEIKRRLSNSGQLSILETHSLQVELQRIVSPLERILMKGK